MNDNFVKMFEELHAAYEEDKTRLHNELKEHGMQFYEKVSELKRAVDEAGLVDEMGRYPWQIYYGTPPPEKYIPPPLKIIMSDDDGLFALSDNGTRERLGITSYN